MRKQMVTLENKAEMLAAQLRQRIGVQRGNILTGDAIGAAGGLIQTAENIHQGRFTGPVFSHQGVDGAAADLQTCVVDRADAAKVFGHMLHLDSQCLLVHC